MELGDREYSEASEVSAFIEWVVGLESGRWGGVWWLLLTTVLCTLLVLLSLLRLRDICTTLRPHIALHSLSRTSRCPGTSRDHTGTHSGRKEWEET